MAGKIHTAAREGFMLSGRRTRTAPATLPASGPANPLYPRSHAPLRTDRSRTYGADPHAQLSPDLADVDGPAFEGERRGPGHHAQPAQLRESDSSALPPDRRRSTRGRAPAPYPGTAARLSRDALRFPWNGPPHRGGAMQPQPPGGSPASVIVSMTRGRSASSPSSRTQVRDRSAERGAPRRSPAATPLRGVWSLVTTSPGCSAR